MRKERMDEKTDRNYLIYKEKLNGVPSSELAEKYKLSAPRIHRICMKEENKALKLKNIKLEAEIAELKKKLN